MSYQGTNHLEKMRTSGRQNVRSTSIETYYNLIRRGQSDTEERKCFLAWSVLKEASDRMIAELTGIEKGNVPRCRRALQNRGQVIYIGVRPCRVTGNKVRYYKVHQQES